MNCIAHGGSANLVPENSMAGIRDAAAQHIKRIEYDISVASDGVAVIFHDESLRRTEGDPRAVLSLTNSELIQIALITHHICPTQYIPLAKNWMRVDADHDLFLHLEIKVHDQELQRVIDATLDAFDRAGPGPLQLRIYSFWFDVIQLIHGYRSELHVGIAAVRLADVLEALGVVSVYLDIDYLDCKAIESAIGRGFKVCIYSEFCEITRILTVGSD